MYYGNIDKIPSTPSRDRGPYASVWGWGDWRKFTQEKRFSWRRARALLRKDQSFDENWLASIDSAACLTFAYMRLPVYLFLHTRDGKRIDFNSSFIVKFMITVCQSDVGVLFHFVSRFIHFIHPTPTRFSLNSHKSNSFMCVLCATHNNSRFSISFYCAQPFYGEFALELSYRPMYATNSHCSLQHWSLIKVEWIVFSLILERLGWHSAIFAA